MKNIIYISLIASILFGCKGSSFLTPKYTKYGHGVAKKSENAKSEEFKSLAIVKNKPNKPAEVKKEENLVTESIEPQTKAMLSLAGITKTLVKLPKKVASKVTFGNQESVNDADPLQIHAKSEIKSDQKVEKSKTSVFKAIIGKVLKIIVLVLTLAVLLIVVFLLISLGVI